MPGNRWDLLDAVPDPAAAPAGAFQTAEISVVIPFFDNQHDLDLLLSALSVQTHPLSRLQIVIADDGSPEPPRVPEAARELDVSIVRQENAGFRAGTARNLGVGRTDGQVLLFLDGDTVPSPDYVQKLARLPLLLPDAVVSGRRRYTDLADWTPTTLLDWFAGRSPGPGAWEEPAWMTQEYLRTEDLLLAHPRSYKYLIGAVLGCSREMYDYIGGFDESIVGYGGEDYDFTYRAYNNGAVFAYTHDAVAWHDGRDWAGRTEPEGQRNQKNREVMMLAARIPEPSVRGHGQIYPVVDVLVAVHAAGWPFGAGVVCVRSLLENLDCLVAVVGSGDSAVDLRNAFAGDPRVREPGAEEGNDGPGGRARVHLTVTEPVTATPAFAERLLSMLETDTGTLSVLVDGRLVLVAETHRSRSRRARHPGVPAEIAGAWFDHWDLALAESGLCALEDEPELAPLFGGY